MNLEQQKKQARELLRVIRSGDHSALARLRRWHGRWAGVDEAEVRQSVALHDAQFVLAREQGFASWPKLKAYAEPSAGKRYTRLFVADPEWIADRVRGLLRTRQSAGPAALEQIREWHPRFADLSDDEILRAPFTEEDARLVYAHEHGFDTWEELTQRVNLLATDARVEATEPFLGAFRALQARDIAGLKALLGRNPQLARARGTNGNTLLNLAVSLAAKADRDVALQMVTTLLTAGADVNDVNDRGWTPLHQAGYSNQPDVAEVLLRRGADVEAEGHGSGGTPLIVALFWGHRDVAEVLSRHGVAPRNLRAAAGIGSAELLEACFRDERSLTAEAGAARGFYRPHSGFPDWRPSPDAQEVLDEALVWAAKSNRVGVMGRLVRGGARVEADVYRGTPLIWAAACNRTAAAEWLLEHEADVNQRGTFGGLTHGQGITALHIAAQNGHWPMIKLLLARGADRSIQDDLYHSTPGGWADYFGKFEARELLRD